MSYRKLEQEREELHGIINNLKGVCADNFHLSVRTTGKYCFNLVGQNNHNRKPSDVELAAFEGVKASIAPLIEVYQKRYDEIKAKLDAVNALLRD